MVKRVSVGVLIVAVALLVAAPAAQAAQPEAARSGVWHVVRWGETLSRIASHYGVSVSAIVAANGLANPNRIWPGQRLFIPSTGVSGGGAARTYTVVWGDTLARIAQRFGVSSWAIAQANHLANPNTIYPGQRLIIPALAYR